MNRLLLRFLAPLVFLLLIHPSALAIEFNNSDFEAGTVGWVSGSTGGTVGSFSIDSDAYSGSNAAKITVSSANGYFSIANGQYPGVDTTGEYVLNLYMKATGSPESVTLAIWKSYSPQTFPTLLVKYITINNISSIYNPYQLSEVSLSAGEYLRLEMAVGTASTGGPGTVWLDAISLSAVNTELQNTISLLQVLAGIDTAFVYEDINNDSKLGLEDILFALQDAAGLRIAIYNPVGIWNGSFTGNYGSGLIINWDLQNDQTITGTVQYNPNIGGVTTININTTYLIDINALSATASGTAIYTHPQLGTMTSGFTMNVSGNLTSDTEMSGSYTIDFVDQGWTDESGAWTATKN